MKRFLFLIPVLLISISCYAFELDTSVDEEIRRHYNPSALEKSLPPLPKTTPNQSVPKTLPVVETPKAQIGVKPLPTQTVYDKSTAIRIKKGTKFKVKSSSYLSDSTQPGARFTFTTQAPVTQRYITLPAGTVFNAVVTDSHRPQATGNGGLLVINTESVNVNGKNYVAPAKITKANGKKIFVNNIKGKHQYWKGVSKQVDKGDKFYKKTRNTSAKLSGNPIGTLVSPIPTAVGMAAYTVNLVGSPIIAIGAKGGNLSIPAGTLFEIKLTEDVYIDK